MAKKKREVSIVRSSAAEYLTFVAATGAQETKPLQLSAHSHKDAA